MPSDLARPIGSITYAIVYHSCVTLSVYLLVIEAHHSIIPMHEGYKLWLQVLAMIWSVRCCSQVLGWYYCFLARSTLGLQSNIRPRCVWMRGGLSLSGMCKLCWHGRAAHTLSLRNKTVLMLQATDGYTQWLSCCSNLTPLIQNNRFASTLRAENRSLLPKNVSASCLQQGMSLVLYACLVSGYMPRRCKSPSIDVRHVCVGTVSCQPHKCYLWAYDGTAVDTFVPLLSGCLCAVL